MRLLSWLVRAIIFFTLFAFALNNLHPVTVRWFFGFEWTTRLVFVVLAAFAAGCAIGVLAMAPGWWRLRRTVMPAQGASAPRPLQSPAMSAPSDFGPEHPPREGP